MTINVREVRAIINAFTCKIRKDIFPQKVVVLSKVSKGQGNHRRYETLKAAIKRRHCVFNLEDIISHFETKSYFPGEIEDPRSVLQLDEMHPPTSFEREKNMVLLALSLAARVGAFNSTGDGFEDRAALEDGYIEIIAKKVNALSQNDLDKAVLDLIQFKTTIERRNPGNQGNRAGEEGGINSETYEYFKAFKLHTVPMPISPNDKSGRLRNPGRLRAGKVFPDELKELIKNANECFSSMKEILQIVELDIEYIKQVCKEVQVIFDVSMTEDEREKYAKNKANLVVTDVDKANSESDILEKVNEALKTAQATYEEISDYLIKLHIEFKKHMRNATGKQKNGAYGHIHIGTLMKESDEIQELFKKTSFEILMQKRNSIVKSRECAEEYRQRAMEETNPKRVLKRVSEIEEQAEVLVNGALNWAMTAKAITQGLIERGNPNITAQIADASVNRDAALKNYNLATQARIDILGSRPQSVRQTLNSECEKAALILTQYNKSRLKHSELFSLAREAKNPDNIGIARKYNNLAKAKAAEEEATNAAHSALEQAQDEIALYKPHITAAFRQLRQMESQLRNIRQCHEYSRANYSAVCDMRNAADNIKP